ncbi:MAG: cysteine desulfurase family protein [Verrucomicrobiales bacterium]
MIYLDNNATTPVCREALEAMTPFLTECWANPSSGYRFARRAREAVELARQQTAALLGAEPEEIVFTSCGTESSNAAIQSAAALYPERKHLVTSAAEHEATLVPCEELEKRGYGITRLGVNREGLIDLGELERSIRSNETALVSLIWANNETGVLQPIAEAAEIAQAKGVLFHTDAVQAAGKMAIDLGAISVHYASFSGHKFHAPKGIGALYIKKTVRFHPWLLGGGQESGRRSGTLNVPYIVSLGAAAEAARSHREDGNKAAECRDFFESEIQRRIEGVQIHGTGAPRLSNTSNIRIDGVDAQGAIILLDNSGICVSSGSACQTGAIQPSHVLTAMGLTPRQARETLRFSFSRMNTHDEVMQAVAALETAVKKLRITRK